MRTSIVVLAVLLLASSAQSQVDTDARATNQLYEQGPINPVIPHQANAGYGNSSVLQVGDKVRMYTTGIDDFSCIAAGNCHDKIWLWENPNTWAGWNTPYTRAAAPLLPSANCTGSTPNACRTSYNYSLSGAWQNPSGTGNSKLYLLAGTGNVQHRWPEVLIGESSDGGKAFKYKGLVQSTNGIAFVQIAWQPLLIDNVWRLFGYVDFKYHPENRSDGRNDQGLGAILFTPSFTAPFLIDANSTLEVWSGGTWKNVGRCAAGSQYTFCLGFDADPDLPAAYKGGANRHPDLYKMKRYGNALELWASGGAADTCVCDRESGWQNVFVYFPVTTPTSRSQDPFSLIGPRKQLLQTATKIRCNPGSYSQSRKHPTRLEWTYNLIYTREFARPDEITKDCPAPDAGPYGWIIATQLTTDY